MSISIQLDTITRAVVLFFTFAMASTCSALVVPVGAETSGARSAGETDQYGYIGFWYFQIFSNSIYGIHYLHSMAIPCLVTTLPPLPTTLDVLSTIL